MNAYILYYTAAGGGFPPPARGAYAVYPQDLYFNTCFRGVCGGRQDALRPAHSGELRRTADRDARRDRACAPLAGAVPRRLMRRARHGGAVRFALPRGLYRKAAERARTLGRAGLRAAVRERRGKGGRLRQERRTRLRPCGAVRARRRIAAARYGRGGRDADRRTRQKRERTAVPESRRTARAGRERAAGASGERAALRRRGGRGRQLLRLCGRGEGERGRGGRSGTGGDIRSGTGG